MLPPASLVVLFLLSDSIVEFSLSGLETPLAIFFTAIFVALIDSFKNSKHQYLLSAFLGLTAAGIFLTRFDLVLLFIPVGIWFIFSNYKRFRAGMIWLAALGSLTPIIIWSAFSIQIYGSVVPNTYFAKTNIEIPAHELIIQGVIYFGVSFAHDPVALLALVGLTAISVALRNMFGLSNALGILLYYTYVVTNGGDFMAGRFLAVPTFLAILAVLIVVRDSTTLVLASSGSKNSSLALIAVVISTLLLLFSMTNITQSLTPTHQQQWDYTKKSGIADERGYYAERGYGVADYFLSPGVHNSTTLRKISRQASDWSEKPSAFANIFVRCGGLGTGGVLEGPEAHFVDPCGLIDSRLAKVPFVSSNFNWRPGHFSRPVNDSYLNSLIAELQIMNSKTAN